MMIDDRLKLIRFGEGSVTANGKSYGSMGQFSVYCKERDHSGTDLTFSFAFLLGQTLTLILHHTEHFEKCVLLTHAETFNARAP